MDIATSRYSLQSNDNDVDEKENLLQSSSSIALNFQHSKRRSFLRIAPIIGAISLAMLIGVGLALWLTEFWEKKLLALHGNKFCLEHSTRWSPLVDQVEANWHTIQFNGSFFGDEMYRGPPGPDTDALWSYELGTSFEDFILPEHEAEKSGLSKSHVRISEKHGGGLRVYVEGLHHLHCLNLLRQALWYNYEYYKENKIGPFENSEPTIRYHVTHCVDILRQQLMCRVDVGIAGLVWYERAGGAGPGMIPDFNTKHRCRDYKAVRDWAKERRFPFRERDKELGFYEQPGPAVSVHPSVP